MEGEGIKRDVLDTFPLHILPPRFLRVSQHPSSDLPRPDRAPDPNPPRFH
jgi:hypothetical protein